MLRWWRPALLLALCPLAFPACSKTATTTSAGLEVVLATDLSVPRDFDGLRLEVAQQGGAGAWHTLFDATWGVPSEVTFPTTFGIAAGTSVGEVARVRATATKGGTPVVLREVEVTVPEFRLAELPVVLAAACYGQVTASGDASCADPSQSCQPGAGTCGPSLLADPSSLPTYAPGAEDTLDAGAPASPPVLDAGTDAGTCAVLGLDPAFHPPTGPRGACSDADISAFYTKCILAGACTPGAVDGGSGVSTACTDCLVAPPSGAAWGPVLESPSWQINAGGCYASEAASSDGGAEVACAQASQALFECERYECVGSDAGGFDACRALADGAACACFARAASVACAPFIASPCTDPGTTWGAFYQAVARQVCGP